MPSRAVTSFSTGSTGSRAPTASVRDRLHRLLTEPVRLAITGAATGHLYWHEQDSYPSVVSYKGKRRAAIWGGLLAGLGLGACLAWALNIFEIAHPENAS